MMYKSLNKPINYNNYSYLKIALQLVIFNIVIYCTVVYLLGSTIFELRS